MKLLRIFSRLFVGILFVFSGFVKTVDPLGSAYKFGDYFSAFGFGFLESLTLPLSVILSSAELTMGIALLLAYRMRFFSWLVMIFMSFFTVLTLILAIYNPISDCGCFGDALILTNWQTFYKNIVIQIFVVFMLLQRNNYREITRRKTEWAVVLMVFLFFSSFAVYSFFHLPVVDFRPYSVGSNIPDKMIAPHDAPGDVYETKLIYKNKNTGTDELFSLENFPTDTSLYSFVDAQSILISKGYEPAIHDFFISSMSGNDITDIIIHDPGFSFLLISHNLSDANKNALKRADDYARFAKLTDNARFYCLTASSNQVIDEIRDDLGVSYEFYHADEITLKTIIRSNPGLLLLKNGTIIGKWHYNDLPAFGLTENDFREIIDNYPFSPGTKLSTLSTPPPGADSDVYETILNYRNIITDSLASFTINNFPASPEWQFVSSESKIIQKGYISPLGSFRPLTPEGLDISGEIISGSGNVFMLMVQNPDEVNNELLTRVNNLSVIAASTDTASFRFYGLTALSADDLIAFTDRFISPIQFASMDEEFIHNIAGKGLALIWIRNGVVMGITRDESIPAPSDFPAFLSKPAKIIDAEQMLIPPTLTSLKSKNEKGIVYIFIFGMIAVGLFLRAFPENKKSD